MNKDAFRIAFISGKLGDVDGVSLEVDKWIEVLSSMGHEIWTIGRFIQAARERCTRRAANSVKEHQLRFNGTRVF